MILEIAVAHNVSVQITPDLIWELEGEALVAKVNRYTFTIEVWPEHIKMYKRVHLTITRISGDDDQSILTFDQCFTTIGAAAAVAADEYEGTWL